MIRPHAYILAGGRSSRFGSDKARAELGGRPLIMRARDSLATSVQSVTVVAERRGKHEHLGLRTIADRTPHLGPLGGLCAAMEDRPEAGLILVSACDLLLPDGDIVELLLSASCPDDRAVAFRDAKRWRPFPGLYSTTILPDVDEMLGGEERSLQTLLDRYGRAITPPSRDLAIDCNTPDALAQAEELIASPGTPRQTRSSDDEPPAPAG